MGCAGVVWVSGSRHCSPTTTRAFRLDVWSWLVWRTARVRPGIGRAGCATACTVCSIPTRAERAWRGGDAATSLCAYSLVGSSTRPRNRMAPVGASRRQ